MEVDLASPLSRLCAKHQTAVGTRRLTDEQLVERFSKLTARAIRSHGMGVMSTGQCLLCYVNDRPPRLGARYTAARALIEALDR